MIYNLLSVVRIAAVYDVNPVTAVEATPDCDGVAAAAIPHLYEIDLAAPRSGSRDHEDDGDMRGRSPGETGQAPDVSVWPGGLEPVRKLLDRESVLALGNEPSAQNRALRLATDLTEAELAGSAFGAIPESW